ncbi:MAG TPA: GDSL-type esterase/lipase family protein [Candidatus Brocadiia bacterium]|nr:GDSL-type esterase/lipase family protein [Candidatus Brocadiia bacterium]
MGKEQTKDVSGRLLRKRIALAIIALCVALTIAEMICRHVFPPVSPDAFEEWANRRIVCESLDEYRTTMTFGPYGYRNPTLPLERRAGVARIVALGDSLTEGVGTDDDGTWPQVCARRLKELGHPAEIANLGENGSDPGGYLVRLAQMGVALRPDIVICCVFQNDVMDPTEALQKMPGFDPVVKRAISPPGGLALPKLFESVIRTGRRPPSPLFPQSAFPAVPDPRNPFSTKPPGLDTRFHEAAKRGKFNPWLLSLPRDYYDRLALAQDKNTLGAMWAMRIALDRMREICNRESIAFFVIYIPEQSAFSEQRKEVLEQLGFSTEHVPAPVDYVRESIERWAAANSVPFLDMSPRLRIEPDAYYRWDLHLTPKGYRIVGEAVAEWLISIRRHEP